MTLLEQHPLRHVTLNESDAMVPLPAPSKTIQANINMLVSRERLGTQKYGTTCDRTDLTHEQWLQHILEEQLDGANYIQAALRTAKEANRDYAVLRDRLDKLVSYLCTSQGRRYIDPVHELRLALFQDDADRVLRQVSR